MHVLIETEQAAISLKQMLELAQKQILKEWPFSATHSHTWLWDLGMAQINTDLRSP